MIVDEQDARALRRCDGCSTSLPARALARRTWPVRVARRHVLSDTFMLRLAAQPVNAAIRHATRGRTPTREWAPESRLERLCAASSRLGLVRSLPGAYP